MLGRQGHRLGCLGAEHVANRRDELTQHQRGGGGRSRFEFAYVLLAVFVGLIALPTGSGVSRTHRNLLLALVVVMLPFTWNRTAWVLAIAVTIVHIANRSTSIWKTT